VISRYRINTSHNLTLSSGGAVHLSAARPAPAAELIDIAPAR
jgi:hypothetical protein